jgi:hypothetical protein
VFGRQVFSLSLESSGQFTNSYCRMLNTCVQDLTVSILLGEVSQRTSVLCIELSQIALVTFRGAIVSGLRTPLSVTENAED